MRWVAVIPTYNEKENVRAMAEAALKALPEDSGVLFVDDNSPDGTGKIIDELCRENNRIKVLHREKKEGLGRAYIAGFQEALKLGAEKVAEMDCDFSHPVEKLKELFETDADVTIGSRYVKGGRCEGWPFKRWLISKAGGIFIRLMTGMKIADPTGGFKAFRRETLEKLDWSEVESRGYSFQLEMNYRLWKKGATIKEIPITFTERRAGKSKLTPEIAEESLRMAMKLSRFRRNK